MKVVDFDACDNIGGERDGWKELKAMWAAKELILVGGSRDLLGASSVLAKTLLAQALSEQHPPMLIGSFPH